MELQSAARQYVIIEKGSCKYNRRKFMKLKDKKPIIIAALRSLGITPRELEITPDADTIGNVYVNGEFFGVFDYVRRTFVD